MSLSPAAPVVKAVQLYQPTESEIAAVLDCARRGFPVLASRCDKAEVMLQCGMAIDPTAWEMRQVASWKFASQTASRVQRLYTVTSNRYCDCPDRAPSLGDRRFCKHLIAVSCYLRLLRDRINADIKVFDVELSMLHTGILHAFAPRLGSVFLEKNSYGVYEFANAASAVNYSVWQARKQAVAWLTSSIANDYREIAGAK